MDLIFVYGTLRAGYAHETQTLLGRRADLVSGASVRGVLYDLGDYPGLVVGASDTDSVRGDVYRLHPPTADETLRLLDAYEGCGPDDPEPHEYRRDRVPVRLDSGESTKAWAYVLVRDVRGLQRIPSGDYSARMQTPHAGRVSERPPSRPRKPRAT